MGDVPGSTGIFLGSPTASTFSGSGDVDLGAEATDPHGPQIPGKAMVQSMVNSMVSTSFSQSFPEILFPNEEGTFFTSEESAFSS